MYWKLASGLHLYKPTLHEVDLVVTNLYIDEREQFPVLEHPKKYMVDGSVPNDVELVWCRAFGR